MATLHPLSLGSPVSFVRAVRTYGGIDPPYAMRALGILASSALGAASALADEQESPLQAMPAPIDPVFIVGHWRSGTTFLHNLLSRDTSFGHVSHLAAMAPGSFLSRARALGRRHRSGVRRPQDEIEISPDSPEEEEFAIANLSTRSFLHAWYFPRMMRPIFDRWALMKGLESGEIEDWLGTYVGFLRKITHAAGGRRLLLKNPANTGRIALLAKRFPSSIFIHIVRDPRDVFRSTVNLYDKVMPGFRLQDSEPRATKENILEFYPALMNQGLDALRDLPVSRRATVRFEDLERDPVQTASALYRKLPLGDFDRVRGEFESYAAAVAGYRKNIYDRASEQGGDIRERWGTVAERLGYSLSER